MKNQIWEAIIQCMFILVIVVLMNSCISQKRCAERYPVPVKTELSVQHDTVTCIRDSLIPLPADSGLIRALLECRDGKVVVREVLEVKPGKRVVPFFSVEKNVLTTGAKIDSSAIYFAWKETHTRESKTEIRTIEKIVFRVSGFQNFLIWSGGIFLAILVMLIGFLLIRLFLKRKLLP